MWQCVYATIRTLPTIHKYDFKRLWQKGYASDFYSDLYGFKSCCARHFISTHCGALGYFFICTFRGAFLRLCYNGLLINFMGAKMNLNKLKQLADDSKLHLEITFAGAATRIKATSRVGDTLGFFAIGDVFAVEVKVECKLVPEFIDKTFNTEKDDIDEIIGRAIGMIAGEVHTDSKGGAWRA